MNRYIPIRSYTSETTSSKPILIVRRIVSSTYPAHLHDFYELELVLRGRGRQWLNSVCVPLERGAFHLLTPSDIHRIEADEPLEFFSVKFMPEVVQRIDFMQRCGAYSAQLGAQNEAYVSRLFERIERETNATGPLGAQAIHATLTLALITLFREGRQHLPTAADACMQRALNCIHERFAQPDLRLKHVADACGLSACHFSSSFHRAIGYSFSQYLRDYRLKQACALIQNSDAPITDIAYETGFSCLPHFFRVFSQTYGCTPREMRRRDNQHVDAERSVPVP